MFKCIKNYRSSLIYYLIMNVIKTYHSKLKKYKDLHKGEVCYIFATGITLNDFKIQEKGIYIGVNMITKSKPIIDNPAFKYYFFGHGYNEKTSLHGGHKEEVDNMRLDIDKFSFVSRNNNFGVHGFNLKDIKHLESINAIPLDLCLDKIHKNIDENSFINHSIVYPACQFALYCGFSKIYLVGCDCVEKKPGDSSGSHYFFKTDKVMQYQNYTVSNHLVKWWEKIHTFKNEMYADRKIININPIGLKNKMDGDIYTTDEKE